MRKQTKKKERDVQTTELQDNDEMFIYFSIYLLALDILAAQSFPMQQQS